MLEVIIPGTVGGIGAIASASYVFSRWSSRRKHRAQLNHALDDLVEDYIAQAERGELPLEPDKEALFSRLGLSEEIESMITEAHRLRDGILFYHTAPSEKTRKRYSELEKELSREAVRLSYVLDPKLLIAASQQEPLYMHVKHKWEGCIFFSTYFRTIQFVGDYRALMGEEAFFKRLEHKKRTEPWYFHDPDYKQRFAPKHVGVF